MWVNAPFIGLRLPIQGSARRTLPPLVETGGFPCPAERPPRYSESSTKLQQGKESRVSSSLLMHTLMLLPSSCCGDRAKASQNLRWLLQPAQHLWTTDLMCIHYFPELLPVLSFSIKKKERRDVYKFRMCTASFSRGSLGTLMPDQFPCYSHHRAIKQGGIWMGRHLSLISSSAQSTALHREEADSCAVECPFSQSIFWIHSSRVLGSKWKLLWWHCMWLSITVWIEFLNLVCVLSVVFLYDCFLYSWLLLFCSYCALPWGQLFSPER